MTKEFDNNLRGALFKNDRKESDSHPNYKGSCEIEGLHFWISAWVKESPQKGKYMSLSFQPKEQQQASARPPAKAGRGRDDDDIPF